MIFTVGRDWTWFAQFPGVESEDPTPHPQQVSKTCGTQKGNPECRSNLK